MVPGGEFANCWSGTNCDIGFGADKLDALGGGNAGEILRAGSRYEIMNLNCLLECPGRVCEVAAWVAFDIDPAGTRHFTFGAHN